MELGGGSHLPLSRPAIGEGVGDSCGGASATAASGPSGLAGPAYGGGLRGEIQGPGEEQAGVKWIFFSFEDSRM